jgi:hypothetical protein
VSNFVLPPPLSPLAYAGDALRGAGAAVLSPEHTAELAGLRIGDLRMLEPSWDRLSTDAHLKDGGKYRLRRHSCFVVSAKSIAQVPHRPHWQPVEYNALHGGIERWFDAMEPAVAQSQAWLAMLQGLVPMADAIKPGVDAWFVEAHPFRITTDAAGGLGRPTPEGAHRDGVDLVVVVLVGRHNIKGGETRVFDAHGPSGQRFTLQQPWTMLLLDDARMIHETTPIQSLDGSPGHRDTLVLTYRSGGFQGPA